jgi:hypothetical protein
MRDQCKRGPMRYSEGAARRGLYWIAGGGLSFWLPPMLIAAAIHESLGVLPLNALAVGGVAAFGVGSRIFSKNPPGWGWMLVGIYILGPASMLVPSLLLHGAASVNVPGEKLWLLAFCLFPPMTLWIATLNGMIFSVLIVTLALPALAVIRRWRARLGVERSG